MTAARTPRPRDSCGCTRRRPRPACRDGAGPGLGARRRLRRRRPRHARGGLGRPALADARQSRSCRSTTRSRRCRRLWADRDRRRPPRGRRRTTRRHPTTSSPRSRWALESGARHGAVGARRRERRRATSRPAPRCGCSPTAARDPALVVLAYPTLLAVQPAPDAALRAALDADPEADTLRPRRRARDVRELPRRPGRRRRRSRAIPGLATAARPRGLPADAHDQRRGRRTPRLGRGVRRARSPPPAATSTSSTEPGTRHGHLNRPEEPAAAASLDRIAARLAALPPDSPTPHARRPESVDSSADVSTRASDHSPPKDHPMTNPAAAELIARSNRLGADPKNTNYAGGNTSAKGTETDPVTGEPVELLWVKGSGGDLGTLTEAGLAVLRLDRMRALVDVYPGVDREDEMVAAFDYCLHGKGGAAPSIDTAMHGLVDAAHVDHLHPDSGIAIATAEGRRGAHRRRSSATRSCGCRGAAPASSSASTSPRSRRRTPRRSAASSAATASPRGATRRRRPRRTRSGSSRPPRRTSTRTARPSPFGKPSAKEYARARGRRAPREGRRPRADDPRHRLARQARWSATSPTTPTRARLPRLSAEHPRLAALGTSCPDHFLRTKVKPMLLDLPADAPRRGAASRG